MGCVFRQEQPDGTKKKTQLLEKDAECNRAELEYKKSGLFGCSVGCSVTTPIFEKSYGYQSYRLRRAEMDPYFDQHHEQINACATLLFRL